MAVQQGSDRAGYRRSEARAGRGLELDRRRFLGVVGAVGIGAAASSVLAACGSSSPGSATTVSKGALPTFKNAVPVTPSMPATANGNPAAYLAYPANPKRVFSEPPAKGGSFSAFLEVTGTPPAVGQNPYWQQINQRLGAKLTVSSWGTDYADRLQTMVAGNDLTDMVQILTSSTPNLGPLLKAKFQDLSEFLAGDAIEKYPYLAALPTQAWKNTVYNGAIYGIPWPLGAIGADNKIRTDLVEQLGLNASPKDGKEFTELFKGLTDPKAQRWAAYAPADLLAYTLEMVGAPNQWKVEGGKWTSMYATEEYKQALSLAKDLWSAGYGYPGSVAASTDTNIIEAFFGGKTMIETGGYTNWSALMSGGVALNPKFRIGGLILPKWEGGGQAAHWQGSGMYTMNAFKRASKSRIEELLAIANYSAVPFGTEEYLFQRYGIAGRDYTLHGTDPVETETGVTEAQDLTLTYMVSGVVPAYVPGFPEVTKAEYQYHKQLQTVIAPLPTVGLVSNTATTTGVAITTSITSLAQSIIVGQQPMSAWAEGVQTWKSQGGDQIAAEYAKAQEDASK